ncbi:hypothetical protein [Aureliella helgolandensis]|uniref:Uncharacterized protein n=1 Tax=Aureliella helgolandensis TaxID=2527968 RepID=A0A518GBH1_9BACT|nr:hypothetical protein [Aureliella helgolandensis]QDV25962.1 hypothetical protein Q31a_43320 [Aureliella helgolandensis]
MIQTQHKIHFKSGRRSRKELSGGVATPQPTGRLPRITKLMALAIRLDHLIKTGQVTDQAELARVGHVSRARLTQIMNLLYLAPDIQEELLHLPVTVNGQDAIIERDLRAIAGMVSWKEQREARKHTEARHIR